MNIFLGDETRKQFLAFKFSVIASKNHDGHVRKLQSYAVEFLKSPFNFFNVILFPCHIFLG